MFHLKFSLLKSWKLTLTFNYFEVIFLSVWTLFWMRKLFNEFVIKERMELAENISRFDENVIWPNIVNRHYKSFNKFVNKTHRNSMLVHFLIFGYSHLTWYQNWRLKKRVFLIFRFFCRSFLLTIIFETNWMNFIFA